MLPFTRILAKYLHTFELLASLADVNFEYWNACNAAVEDKGKEEHGAKKGGEGKKKKRNITWRGTKNDPSEVTCIESTRYDPIILPLPSNAIKKAAVDLAGGADWKWEREYAVSRPVTRARQKKGTDLGSSYDAPHDSTDEGWEGGHRGEGEGGISMHVTRRRGRSAHQRRLSSATPQTTANNRSRAVIFGEITASGGGEGEMGKDGDIES